MKFKCENLEVYDLSRELIVKIYTITKKFPQSEKYGLRSQVRRSVTSISLNIAEGSGKSTNKNFANFIRIAIGSLIETDTSLKIAMDLNFITSKDYEKIDKLTEKTYFKLIGLHKYLKNNNVNK
jgi:four helix bundle protein